MEDSNVQVIYIPEPEWPELKVLNKEKIAQFNDPFTYVPSQNHGGIVRYFEQGIIPGSFLGAVLRNDLQGAIGQADDDNIKCIHSIVAWLYNYAPGGSWGYQNAPEDWKKTLKEWQEKN